ncbi:hypothetical protein HPB48_015700 [Haemaphysalis longicornis]|uniref:P-type domain-containing protein n=1 Tax=Haemaphysalis longicornis TaxID=44386 RepID=A0A9J6FU28_HAELO|nr:hypothetical protein HPB48_015700 [Haemaphysalis longicornis]
MARSAGPIVLPSLLWLAALTALGGAARVFQMGRRYDFSQIPKTARIQVYYESLCPYSIAFITEQLWPTFVRVGYLMDVQLVPFGNAFKEQPQTQQEQPDQAAADSADCQHGPEECFGNVVHSCAAHIFNDTILSLAFVTCMSLAQRPQEAGEECARGIARNWDAIQRCAHGGKGLRLQMSERTWNLDPPHHYVPWIVVNGEHTDDIQAMAQTDLLQVVCDATPDGRKPPPCFEDMERRRALQKLSASVEERLGDGAAQPGAAAGHSLKDELRAPEREAPAHSAHREGEGARNSRRGGLGPARHPKILFADPLLFAASAGIAASRACWRRGSVRQPCRRRLTASSKWKQVVFVVSITVATYFYNRQRSSFYTFEPPLNERIPCAAVPSMTERKEDCEKVMCMWKEAGPPYPRCFQPTDYYGYRLLGSSALDEDHVTLNLTYAGAPYSPYAEGLIPNVQFSFTKYHNRIARFKVLRLNLY